MPARICEKIKITRSLKWVCAIQSYALVAFLGMRKCKSYGQFQSRDWVKYIFWQHAFTVYPSPFSQFRILLSTYEKKITCSVLKQDENEESTENEVISIIRLVNS